MTERHANVQKRTLRDGASHLDNADLGRRRIVDPLGDGTATRH